MNTQQAKQIRIDDYLAHLGYSPKQADAKRLMYLSMLAPNGEKTPSFQVSADGHAFHDWSTGASGSIVDLAMYIIGSYDVSAALAHIESTVGRISSSIAVNETSFSLYQQKKSLEVVSVRGLNSLALLAYAKGRGIPADIARAYCSEVRYRIAGSGKEFYSLGWLNDSDGWELRNRYSKLAAAPKDVSTVNDLCDCTFLVLEGFFDFLSAVALRWFRPMEMNAVVLNSTALLERAFPLLQQATRIVCLLDNDDSGREATARILHACPLAEDHSHLYAGYNDLNDYLMNNSTINKDEDE